MKNILDKMASRGVEALSDRELLALLTDDEQLAEVVLSAYDGSLARIGDQPEARLRMVGGLGLKRARMLLAAAEFGRRAVAAGVSGADFINTGDDVVRLFRPQLERLSYEECWAVFLTSSNRVIERYRISQGGVTGTVVDHRLIVKRALELLATQLILVHNHPSGTPEASAQDKALTERVARRGAVRHPAAGPHHHRPRRGFLVPARRADGVAVPPISGHEKQAAVPFAEPLLSDGTATNQIPSKVSTKRASRDILLLTVISMPSIWVPIFQPVRSLYL